MDIEKYSNNEKYEIHTRGSIFLSRLVQISTVKFPIVINIFKTSHWVPLLLTYMCRNRTGGFVGGGYMYRTRIGEFVGGYMYRTRIGEFVGGYMCGSMTGGFVGGGYMCRNMTGGFVGGYMCRNRTGEFVDGGYMCMNRTGCLLLVVTCVGT